MKFDKLLTITIPTYNRAIYVDKLLKSIYSQYDQRLEIIVSDNASIDDTEQIVKKYPDVVYIKNETNIGFDANLLQCYKKATGKYIWSIGSDDLVYPGAIPHILNFLTVNEGVTHVFLNHNFYKYDEDPTKNKNIRLNIKNDLVLKDKNKWLKICNMRITYMSVLIIASEVLSRVEDMSKYIGSWFIHTCIALDSSKYGNYYGVISKCCVSDNLTPENANYGKKETWTFSVFGEKLYHIYFDLALNCGFKRRTLKKIYSKNACYGFGKAIISFKAHDVEWKEDFYRYAYPYTKKFVKTWLFTIPCTLIPRIFCRFIDKYIKPIVKKIKRGGVW